VIDASIAVGWFVSSHAGALMRAALGVAAFGA
jgi:hypothetical protein